MNLFLDDLPLWFDPDGVCRGPAGDGRVALIARADVGAVSAAVLAADGYRNETLDLSGDEAPTIAEFAAICSEESGRDLRYEPGTRADYIASRLAQGRRPLGRRGRRRLVPGGGGGRAGCAVGRRAACHRSRSGARSPRGRRRTATSSARTGDRASAARSDAAAPPTGQSDV